MSEVMKAYPPMKLKRAKSRKGAVENEALKKLEDLPWLQESDLVMAA